MRNSILLLLIFVGACTQKCPAIFIEECEQQEIKQTEPIQEFSLELFLQEIDKYSWRFKDIVIAQAIQESGLKLDHKNNLFGMKVAKSRITTAKSAKGSKHARYNTWQESITDRALFEASFMRKLKTEEDYYEYLAANYATDKKYIYKLRRIKDGLPIKI